jgi:hypothetical protein
MATRTRTTGHFTYANWEEENRTSGGEAGPTLARATVVNAFSGGIEAEATDCAYSIVYLPGQTGTFTGHELLTGRVDGREGTFVAEQRGTFGADHAVHCTFEVVPGSGTGHLAGLRGSGSFTAKKGESSVHYTFDYELD